MTYLHHLINQFNPGDGKTYPTDETIGMPLTVESRDVALGDGRGTSFTFQSEHGQIVLLAVRLAVLLLESILAKLAAALGAEKVIRMPRLIQSRHAFLFNVQFAIDDGQNIQKKKKNTNPKIFFKKSN
jgi:hypothetical protein